jgi:hypothetical protein
MKTERDNSSDANSLSACPSRRIGRAPLALLALLALGLAVPSPDATAQGTIRFGIRLSSTQGNQTVHVWGPSPTTPTLSLVGLGSNDTPVSGTTPFAENGMTLIGANGTGGAYGAATTYAQLLGAPGANQPESALVPLGIPTTFRTGAGAGTWTTFAETLPGFPEGSTGTFEVVAWDARQYTTWPQASAAWQAGSIAAGKGGVFNVSALGGSMTVPPSLNQQALLASFNLYFDGRLPSVVTLPATDVIATSASLNATVNPNGIPTLASFYWGTNNHNPWYDNFTGETDMGSGTNALSLSVPIAGLTPGVTYHFCVYARAAGKGALGNDQSFTTSTLPPPDVRTLSASAVSATNATLNGTVNPSGFLTSAWFQLGTTTNYGNLTPVSNMGSGTNVQALSVPLAGLTPGVTYHFRVAATNSNGPVYGSDQSFTTLPPEVWTLPATAVSTTAATLNGTANPNGHPSSAWFQWGTTTSYGNLTPATDIGGGADALPLSVPVTGLAPGVTYHFRAVVTNGAVVVYGSDQSFTTLQTPTVATLPATLVTNTQATLNATVNPKGYLTTAWFEWGTSTSYGNLTAATSMGSGTYDLLLSVPLAGLTRGVAYHFRVAATNINGAAYGSDQLFTPSGGTGIVYSCSEAALRAEMAGGGTVTFGCDGTITLANTITNSTDVILDGSGHGVVIAGSNGVRVFWVGTNTSLGLVNLTITSGQVPSGAGYGGAAIMNSGGTVNANNCWFAGSVISNSPSGDAYGGAIYNAGGLLQLLGCTFAGSSARGLFSWGGAIYSSGTVVVDSCAFSGSVVSGADASPTGVVMGGDGIGGAIYSTGALLIRRSTFAGNGAHGGTGEDTWPGDGGGARGGAIYNLGTLNVESSTFLNNSALGGAGGRGYDGHTLPTGAPTDGGQGGAGGMGAGAALCNNGTAILINSTFAQNSGGGGTGGPGGKGGVGTHGNGQDGPPGPSGAGYGAIYGFGQLYLTNCTVAFNSASTDGGGIRTGGGVLVNTLLAANTPGNCSGSVTDGGHNLSSDGTCGFTGTGSMNNTDSRIGPLANNGGPTLTMALLPGSPAIDAADPAAAPAIDQRGFPRPAGAALDIGAFEYGSVMPMLLISHSGAAGLNILGSGNAGQWCRLLSSSNLLDWTPVATNQLGSDGTYLFPENCAAGGARRFYRMLMP